MSFAVIFVGLPCNKIDNQHLLRNLLINKDITRVNPGLYCEDLYGFILKETGTYDILNCTVEDIDKRKKQFEDLFGQEPQVYLTMSCSDK
jgi:hypothetical protein